MSESNKKDIQIKDSKNIQKEFDNPLWKYEDKLKKENKKRSSLYKSKIRCKNCYRVLNDNEEYCTNCGYHSEEMQYAMLTGNYGPNNPQRFKASFLIYMLAGFVLCGILQVIFAVIENKANGGMGYTQIYSQTNAIFFSSILTTILSVILIRKDFLEYIPDFNKTVTIKAVIVSILVIIVIALISIAFKNVNYFPSYIREYLTDSDSVIFSLTKECIVKIMLGTMLTGVSIEILIKKYLIDLFDNTLLNDKLIFIIVVIISSILEAAWIMSLEVVIPIIIINMLTTGIYMYANRNVFLNVMIRVILTTLLTIIFLI